MSLQFVIQTFFLMRKIMTHKKQQIFIHPKPNFELMGSTLLEEHTKSCRDRRKVSNVNIFIVRLPLSVFGTLV